MAINLNSTPTQHEREVIPSGVYRLCAEIKLAVQAPAISSNERRTAMA
jgi:hypothetical protein